MNKKRIKAVLLYAPDWCKMSRNIREPFLRECRALGVTHEILNVEEHDGLELSKRYGMRNPPAVLVMMNGKVVAQERGKYCYKIIENYL